MATTNAGVKPGHVIFRTYRKSDLLQARAVELGYSKLILDTLVTQKAAQALYLKNGFVEIGRQIIEQWQIIVFEKQLTI